jgi:O-acetyl-ADP-ribose deacetylase (regulator of RNase III)
MNTKVILVDINEDVVKAWRDIFIDNPEVEVHHGSMLDQQVDAWVTPTNSMGRMNGGLDQVLKDHFGASIEGAVQKDIETLYGGTMPVGAATCVATGGAKPSFLISTPTMVGCSDNISQTQNVAFACAAALQAVHIHNRKSPDTIESVAIAGLGAQTGQVPVEVCARLMWSAYHLFRRHRFHNFEDMRERLAKKLEGKKEKGFKIPITYIEGPLLTEMKKEAV